MHTPARQVRGAIRATLLFGLLAAAGKQVGLGLGLGHLPRPKQLPPSRSHLRVPVARNDAIRELRSQLQSSQQQQPVLIPSGKQRTLSSWAPIAAEARLDANSDGLPLVSSAAFTEEEGTTQMWSILESNADHLSPADRLAIRSALRTVLADLVQLREAEEAVAERWWLREAPNARVRGPSLSWAASAEVTTADRPSADGELARAMPRALGEPRSFARQQTLVSFAVAAASTLLSIGCDVGSAIAALLGDTLVTPERPTWPAGSPAPSTVAAEKILRSEWLLRRLLLRTPERELQLLDDARAMQVRRYLLAGTGDPRALALLLARRVVELRASARFPRARQLALALEALQVLAPAAQALGLGSALPELESDAFRLLFPASYRKVGAWLDEAWSDADAALEATAHELRALLLRELPAGTSVLTQTRKKGLPSLFRKLIRQPDSPRPDSRAREGRQPGAEAEGGAGLGCLPVLGSPVASPGPGSSPVASPGPGSSPVASPGPGSSPGAGPGLEAAEERGPQLFDVLGIRVVLSPAAVLSPDQAILSPDAAILSPAAAQAAAARAEVDPGPSEAAAEALREREAEAALCYQARDALHSASGLWRAVDGRYKDYIRLPKPNGYRALHTTVELCASGYHVEVQLRGRAMDEHAEWGAAAHNLYKANLERSERLAGARAPPPEPRLLISAASPDSARSSDSRGDTT